MGYEPGAKGDHCTGSALANLGTVLPVRNRVGRAEVVITGSVDHFSEGRVTVMSRVYPGSLVRSSKRWDERQGWKQG